MYICIWFCEIDGVWKIDTQNKKKTTTKVPDSWNGNGIDFEWKKERQKRPTSEEDEKLCVWVLVRMVDVCLWMSNIEHFKKAHSKLLNLWQSTIINQNEMYPVRAFIGAKLKHEWDREKRAFYKKRNNDSW